LIKSLAAEFSKKSKFYHLNADTFNRLNQIQNSHRNLKDKQIIFYHKDADLWVPFSEELKYNGVKNFITDSIEKCPLISRKSSIEEAIKNRSNKSLIFAYNAYENFNNIKIKIYNLWKNKFSDYNIVFIEEKSEILFDGCTHSSPLVLENNYGITKILKIDDLVNHQKDEL
jgi:hypothetical protein